MCRGDVCIESVCHATCFKFASHVSGQKKVYGGSTDPGMRGRMNALKNIDARRLSYGPCVPRFTVGTAYKGEGLEPSHLCAQSCVTKVLCLGRTITHQKTHDEDDTGGGAQESNILVIADILPRVAQESCTQAREECAGKQVVANGSPGSRK